MGVLFVAGALLVGKTIFNIYQKNNLVSNDGAVSAELKRVRESDLKVLRGETEESEAQVASSLARYTSQDVPEAELMIQKYLVSDSELIRSSAIEASGAYQWADIKLFSDALNSEIENTRLAALRGLSKRSDSSRIELVENFIKEKNLTDKEWLFSRLTLIRLKSEPAEKKALQVEILAHLKKWPEEVQTQAYLGLFRVFPRDKEMIAVAQAQIQKTESAVAVNAFQYLASFDSEWLKKNFSSLALRDDYTYQLILVDFMATHCPDGWQEKGVAIEAQPAAPDIVEYLRKAELSLKCKAQ